MVSFALALRAEQPFWWTFPGTLSLTVPEKRNMCSDRSMEVKQPVPCGNYSRQTDRPTNRATNRPTATADKGAHREVTLPKIKKFKMLFFFRKSWFIAPLLVFRAHPVFFLREFEYSECSELTILMTLSNFYALRVDKRNKK